MQPVVQAPKRRAPKARPPGRGDRSAPTRHEIAPLPPRPSAVDACSEALERAILRGEIGAGERLPPERALADQLGVNRLTLRAALARLQAQGLISARQGSGTLVEDFRTRGGPALLSGLARAAAETGDLAEVAADLLLLRRNLARAVLERLASGVAARHRKAFSDAVARFEALAVTDPSPADVAPLDVEVVEALLAATERPVLRLCLNPVLAVLAELPALRDAMYGRPRDNAAGWRALSAWLEAPVASGVELVVAELARRDAATLQRLRRAR